jgi:type IV secretion system protein VirD4
VSGRHDDIDLFAALAVVAAAVGAALWSGTTLATVLNGTPRVAPLDTLPAAVAALAAKPAAPAEAWPPHVATHLPSAITYWAATILSTATLVFAAATISGRRRYVGSRRRQPLGVDANPTFAGRRALAPLRVGRRLEPDRFLLGRHHRMVLATENGRRRGPRHGDRGAVALIGPSRSGKTTAAVTGILGWRGPAVLSSVKADLLAATVDARRAQGDIRLYDPTASTGRQGDGRWSPIRLASTTVAAQRAARSLCDAAPNNGVEGGMDFWLAQVEILLSGLLFVAHHTGGDMTTVAKWVLTQDRPSPLGQGEVRDAINTLMNTKGAAAVGAEEARRALSAVWALEDKVLSSVYATAQTVVWPWSDPGVALAAKKPNITLDWLTSGANTAYLCAPIEDQRRLAPAFAGLVDALIKEIFLHVARTGRPLEPPLLIVIDEAGNTPLRALPEYASTLAGLGVVLVTVWQSLAQIEASYARQADTILSNHLTKLIFPGASDTSTLRYISHILGDVEVETSSRSYTDRSARASTQVATTRAGLAPAHTVRQMRRGEALLIHGTLPPAHVRTIPHHRLPRAVRRRTTLDPSRQPPNDSRSHRITNPART